MAYLEDLKDYVQDFAKEMIDRLVVKKIQYGDTWKNRPVEPNDEFAHQNERFTNWFLTKLEDWESKNIPINWIDVACEALICWVRERELDKEKK